MKCAEHPSPWSPGALALARKRYLADTPLSPDQWLAAVSRHLCAGYQPGAGHRWQQAYFQLLRRRAFLPTSAALHNALRGQGGLAGCMVLPLPAATAQALQGALPEILRALQSGTGVGLDLGAVPPRLSLEPGSGRTAPGPVTLMNAIAAAADGPMAYAGVKRAALMGTLPAEHPDIFEFIAAKGRSRLGSVNLSVAFDAALVEGLRRDGFLPLLSPWLTARATPFLEADLGALRRRAEDRSVPPPDLRVDGEGNLFSAVAGRVVGRALGGVLYWHAGTLLEVLAECAHGCGDPGLINLGAINAANPTHPGAGVEAAEEGVGVLRAVTPCGEQPLLPYEVCHLGSLNLRAFASPGGFDFPGLEASAALATRLMDDLISRSDPEFEASTRLAALNRKLGIGFMGLADALATLGLAYDRPEGRAMAGRFAATIRSACLKASEGLAQERGPFPNWPRSVFCAAGERPRRHATLTTVAPTGHLATLADCSPGIEPYYLLRYRRDAAGLHTEGCPVLDRALAALGYSLDRWIQATRARNGDYRFDGTLAGLRPAPTADAGRNRALHRLKEVFKTAHEIEPLDHLRMVAELQRHVDNGISKTINLPHGTSVAEVCRLFAAGIFMGLKGITVFRDGCLDRQALAGVAPGAPCRRCGEEPLPAAAEGLLAGWGQEGGGGHDSGISR